MEEEVRGTVDQNEEVRTAAEPVDVPTAEELAEAEKETAMEKSSLFV